jgi:predicted enzyme related to lactoylglutathione lyase
MESIIANLLAAFEQGRIDRRQLIRSIAIAVVGGRVLASPQGVLAADAPRPLPEPAPAFRTVGLSHISYSVADYARSRDFYADLMGWEVTRDNGKNGAVLAIDRVGLMIVRNAEHVPTGGPTGVIDHIAFRIADFDADAVRTELERRGLMPKRDQGGPLGTIATMCWTLTGGTSRSPISRRKADR